MKNRFIFWIALTAGSPAIAESYSAQQIVDIAISNSSLLKAGELDSQAKEKLSAQAGSWDNPIFEVGSENKKELGGDTRSIRYGLSQSLYMPGRFSARSRIANADAELAKLDVAELELKLRGSILALVYEYKAAQEKFGHAEERLERFRTVQGFIKSRVFASPQKKVEASIVTAKLFVLQKEFFHLRVLKENIWNELNSYLKMSTEPEIKVSWMSKGPKLSLTSLASEIEAHSPDLKKQFVKVDQIKNESELASLDSWPSLTVSGNYSDGSGYAPEKIIGLGVSFPLPILNTNRYARSAANIRSQAESERLNFMREQAAKNLKSAFLNFELASKSIENLPVKKMNDLEKSIQEADRGFKRGQVDLLTYLEADSQHFESISAILEAQIDLIRSLTDLQNLTGQQQLLKSQNLEN